MGRKIKGIPEKEYREAYYEANKDKIKAYYEANKDKIKAYYEANKDKIKAYREAKKRTHVKIPTFGGKGKHYAFSNGFTEELKPLVPMIKEKILQDCIKNPRKYLDDPADKKVSG